MSSRQTDFDLNTDVITSVSAAESLHRSLDRDKQKFFAVKTENTILMKQSNPAYEYVFTLRPFTRDCVTRTEKSSGRSYTIECVYIKDEVFETPGIVNLDTSELIRKLRQTFLHNCARDFSAIVANIAAHAARVDREAEQLTEKQERMIHRFLGTEDVTGTPREKDANITVERLYFDAAKAVPISHLRNLHEGQTRTQQEMIRAAYHSVATAAAPATTTPTVSPGEPSSKHVNLCTLMSDAVFVNNTDEDEDEDEDDTSMEDVD